MAIHKIYLNDLAKSIIELENLNISLEQVKVVIKCVREEFGA